MRFTETVLSGTYVIDLEPHRDERGSFARAFCAAEYAAAGLNSDVVQANLSHNPIAGTLRGLHYQVPPAAETKTVRCLRGRIYDVVVDLQPASPTKLRWLGIELSADDGRALYVPEGFAHGFLTLVDDTLVSYHVSAPYTPGTERGLRWDDPALGIHWPREVRMMSDKDRSWPLLEEAVR